MDIKTAFLYSHIKEEVYLEIPQGLKIDKNKYALRLNKAIYGLKPSSRIWYERLRVEIVYLGFQQFVLDSCVFYKRIGNEFAVFIVYVDDLLVASTSQNWLQETIKHLESKF